MNLVEVKQILEKTGFPVAYFQFNPTPTKPVPQPPYICYLTPYSSNMFADDEVYIDIENVQIELYTVKKDLSAEALVKGVLNQHKIPFETTESYIDSQQLFQKIYEVRL
jgi:hypothetical protein